MNGRRLTRPRHGKMLAGVCAGVARYLDWDVTLVRVAFILFGLFGAGELAYLVLWILMPKEASGPLGA
ncbi:MAG: PspC domain-containing protein [Actinomycetota bacterium]|nr:PspC domain-containing protein [Actinomycetota bacterium]